MTGNLQAIGFMLTWVLGWGIGGSLIDAGLTLLRRCDRWAGSISRLCSSSIAVLVGHQQQTAHNGQVLE